MLCTSTHLIIISIIINFVEPFYVIFDTADFHHYSSFICLLTKGFIRIYSLLKKIVQAKKKMITSVSQLSFVFSESINCRDWSGRPDHELECHTKFRMTMYLWFKNPDS